jgi:hypothetical protein
MVLGCNHTFYAVGNYKKKKNINVVEDTHCAHNLFTIKLNAYYRNTDDIIVLPI